MSDVGDIQAPDAKTESGDPEPPFVRNITGVSGFAYGVIGADIHVFGDGQPVYLLANWQTELADRTGS
jgi:hypothetical protein